MVSIWMPHEADAGGCSWRASSDGFRYALTMSGNETVMFNGVRFRRYPESGKWSDRMYFTPGVADRQRGVKRLHEEIWMHHNGRQIPSDCHIHHKDDDALNNDPNNLVCLTDEEHREHHSGQRRGTCTEGQLQHLAEIRPLASEWHGSAEGSEWHRQHGHSTWAARLAKAPKVGVCEYGKCGAEFETYSIHGNDRFCSNKCRSAWRRQAGIDDEDRICHHCGQTFSINKYSKAAHCSKSCAKRCRRTTSEACPVLRDKAA